MKNKNYDEAINEIEKVNVFKGFYEGTYCDRYFYSLEIEKITLKFLLNKKLDDEENNKLQSNSGALLNNNDFNEAIRNLIKLCFDGIFKFFMWHSDKDKYVANIGICTIYPIFERILWLKNEELNKLHEQFQDINDLINFIRNLL